MKTHFLSFLLLLAFTFSCTTNDSDVPDDSVNSVDLYVAGAENNQACYWKNGQKTLLTNGTGLYALQVIVENNDIYVYGGKITEYSSGLSSEHYYLWKNNVRYNLDEYLQDVPDPGPYTTFNINRKMVVENGNIYFCGMIREIDPATNQAVNTYCFWKNGIKNVMATLNNNSSAGAYNVIDNNVYLGLRINPQYNPTSWETVYYKNNTPYSLAMNSQIYGFFKGPDTGIYAFYRNPLAGEKYIKNIQTGAFIPFPANPPGEITDFAFDGNDRYFIGNDFYYKNSDLMMINDPDGYNLISGFKVKNQQVYTIRYKENAGPGALAKVYMNNTAVMSQPLKDVLDPDAGGFFSLLID